MKKIDKNKKSLIKIATATMVAIFSLASMFAGTYAWFTLQSSATASGAEFRVVVTSGAVKSISAHSYLGLNGANNSYCFNPEGKTVYKDGVSQDASLVSLNGYAPTNPSHPIMLIFQVDGAYASIRFKTDYCYLGNTDKYCTVTATYANYAALNTAAGSFTNQQNGNYYKVTTDETHSSASNVYYQYNSADQSKPLRYMSEYHEITAVCTDHNDLLSKTSTYGKGYYRVTTDDADHGGGETVYQYADGELKMVYLKLKSTNNPLSSAVKFNWMRFKNSDVTITGTYGTYALLSAATGSLTDGKYYKVTADENVGGGETVYRYTSGNLILAWDYLDNDNVSHTMTSIDTVNVEQYSNKEYGNPVSQTRKTVSVKKNILTSDHESSFCTFDQNTPSFHNEAAVFSHSLDGAQYVGVVIDYNSDAIEYICSVYLGHPLVNQGLGFHCDWTTII